MTITESSTSPVQRIRRASLEDASSIADCVRAAYEPWVSVIGIRPGPMNDDYAEVVLRSQVWVIAAESGLDGVLVLGIEDEGFLLENIAVHPQAKGKGLGRSLLDLAERQAICQGFNSIYLYTHERMISNRALYRNRGYVEFDRRLENGFSRVYMRKNLDPQ